jgi:hypothetical protein
VRHIVYVCNPPCVHLVSTKFELASPSTVHFPLPNESGVTVWNHGSYVLFSLHAVIKLTISRGVCYSKPSVHAVCGGIDSCCGNSQWAPKVFSTGDNPHTNSQWVTESGAALEKNFRVNHLLQVSPMAITCAAQHIYSTTTP